MTETTETTNKISISNEGSNNTPFFTPIKTTTFLEQQFVYPHLWILYVLGKVKELVWTITRIS